jgi:hypothetical protein
MQLASWQLSWAFQAKLAKSWLIDQLSSDGSARQCRQLSSAHNINRASSTAWLWLAPATGAADTLHTRNLATPPSCLSTGHTVPNFLLNLIEYLYVSLYIKLLVNQWNRSWKVVGYIIFFMSASKFGNAKHPTSSLNPLCFPHRESNLLGTPAMCSQHPPAPVK